MLIVPFFSRKGFSLIELSIVLLSISFLAAAGFMVAAQNTRDAKQRELVQKMDAIEKSLKAFVRQNGKLPCPARPNSYPYFAYDKSLTCHSNWNATYQSRRNSTLVDGTTSYQIVGVVPVSSLGLPDDAGVDPWGNMFTYAMETMTRATGVAQPLWFYNAQSDVGGMTVRDSGGVTLTNRALAVVLSHGPNGNGAWPYKQTASATTSRPGASDSTTGDTDELKNCHCSVLGVRTSAAWDGIFVQKPYKKSSTNIADSFDDTLRYYRRRDFAGPADLATEN